jgi:hypothetical protein
LLCRFSIQDSIPGEGQVKTEKSHEEKKQTGADERHHDRGDGHAGDRPEEDLAPTPVPKAAFAGQHRGGRDEQGGTAEKNVDDESRLEDAIHFHSSFLPGLT